MCGRFTLTLSPENISEYFGIDINLDYDFIPRYNIAPSQNILVIKQLPESKPEFCIMRWGLVPAWQKEEDISTKWVNALSKSIDEKPLFKKLFLQKRCLIVADGFYEWQETKQTKHPYYIYKNEHNPFLIPAIWERWENNHGKVIESCCLLTTEAAPKIERIHHRMPVILQKTQISQWLDTENQSLPKLKSLLTPYLPNDLTFHEVATLVNNPRNSTQECIKLIEEASK